METKTIIKVGLTAGLVSALFPSIPTIYKMGYYKENWFWYYLLIGLGIVSLIMVI